MTIDYDLPCAGCGYNLRTLPRDGVCPECGESVAESELSRTLRLFEDRALRDRGEAWMSSTADALYLGLGAWCLSTFAALAPYGGRDAAGAIVLVAAFAAWCWFGWRLFAPARRATKVFGRSALVGLVTCLLVSHVNQAWAFHYFGRVAPLPWPLGDRFFEATQAVATLRPHLFLLSGAAVIGRLFYITWIARRFIAFAIMAVLIFVSSLAFLPYEIRASAQTTMPPLESAPILAWLGVAVWFFLLIGRLTRAIRLGGSPVASSRS